WVPLLGTDGGDQHGRSWPFEQVGDRGLGKVSGGRQESLEFIEPYHQWVGTPQGRMLDQLVQRLGRRCGQLGGAPVVMRAQDLEGSAGLTCLRRPGQHYQTRTGSCPACTGPAQKPAAAYPEPTHRQTLYRGRPLPPPPGQSGYRPTRPQFSPRYSPDSLPADFPHPCFVIATCRCSLTECQAEPHRRIPTLIGRSRQPLYKAAVR